MKSSIILIKVKLTRVKWFPSGDKYIRISAPSPGFSLNGKQRGIPTIKQIRMFITTVLHCTKCFNELANTLRERK